MGDKGGARLRVVFSDRAWREDLARASAPGRAVARAARHELEEHGVARERLLRCQGEGRDGTRLGGCQKLYLGDQGLHGIVFVPALDETQALTMLCLAFGERHPAGEHESVYQTAHRRLLALRR